MTSAIWIISGGVNYHLTNGGTAQQFYAGSGTPWTAAATTPFQIANNDVTGPPWTPQNALRQEIYSGSPPLRNGRDPLYVSYDNIIQTIPLQLCATSHDNAVTLLQMLRRITNTALFSVPAILAIQPDGATRIVYYEIYGADIQEDARFINEPSSKGRLRAQMTMRCSFAGGLLTTPETLLSTKTFTNTGTGANNNAQAYSTGAGDLIYEGQPLNIVIAPGAQSVGYLYAASVYSRVYDTTGSGAHSTSSTLGAFFYTSAAFDVSARLANQAIKGRFVLRVSAFSSNLQITASVQTGGTVIYTTGWIQPAFTGVATLIVSDDIDLSFLRRRKGLTAANLTISVIGRSTNGSSASMTLTYQEFLLVYDFARIFPNTTTSATIDILIDSFAEQSGVPCLPWGAPEMVLRDTSANALLTAAEMRGTAPRYWSGASLYLAWVTAAGVHSTSATAVITATHAPLYKTLRGNG